MGSLALKRVPYINLYAEIQGTAHSKERREVRIENGEDVSPSAQYDARSTAIESDSH